MLNILKNEHISVGKLTPRTLDCDGNVVSTSLNKHDTYHKNYLEYLETCWAQHLGVVVTPDIFWNMFLCQIAELVKEKPEQYRHIFSNHKQQQEIVIKSNPLPPPILSFIGEISKKLPTDTNLKLFFPTFSTTTPNCFSANLFTFADLCSPYYKYTVSLCGIPFFSICGTKEDYQKLVKYSIALSDIFVELKPVCNQLKQIPSNLDNLEFWNNMFSLTKCGSGTETTLIGWICNLFRQQPSLPFIQNYTSCISQMKYKVLETGDIYVVHSGLFGSTLVDNALVPEFELIVNRRSQWNINEN